MNIVSKNTSLLKRIIMNEKNENLKVDLSGIEKIITKVLPAELEKNAPSNFPELYFEFKQEYERFKEFILFDKLIGRNVVALGGGFSSGKSSFLNSLLGSEILPSDVTPSTSVPAYLINDSETAVYGINAFESIITMKPEEVELIAHGFGKDDDDGKEVTLGHLLKSLFIALPKQPFKHLALLDTPGYSKPDTGRYSARTDEKIARTQLNSANFILWFVEADKGTITSSDINFLKSLNPEIPKLIIVNKADKIFPDELDEVVGKIRDTLQIKGIRFVDILTYSSHEPDDYDKDKILEYIKKWDNAITESRFAYNFKVLFTKCKEYYEELLLERRKYKSRISKSSLYADHDFVITFLDELDKKTTNEMKDLKKMIETLSELQYNFFDEVHKISKKVGIRMPEPTEIDLIDYRMEN